MIASLSGSVADKGSDWVILNVAGVGYRLWVSTTTVVKVPSPGTEMTLHTYLHVREDALHLYGFGSANEKHLFEKLISVSGIGPKVALAILSNLAAERLAQAITTGDDQLLASVPGVGKKTAARLILELREKLSLPETCLPVAAVAANVEAREALVGLGYSIREADAAIAAGEADLDTEQCVKMALRRLGAGV